MHSLVIEKLKNLKWGNRMENIIICCITADHSLTDHFENSSKLLEIKAVTARSLEEASAQFAAAAVDGVVLDPTLPESASIDLAKWVHEKLGNSSLMVMIQRPIESDTIHDFFKTFVEKVKKDRSFFKEIQEEYKQSIPQKIAKLEELVDQMRKTILLEPLEALKFHVHKIAGSSGIYGYRDVSVLCKQFEQELISKIQLLKEAAAPPSPNAEWIADFDSKLAKIKQGFDKP